MGIGNNTYYLVVDLDECEAVTPRDDKRAACRFDTIYGASRYREANQPSGAEWIIVKVPA